MDVSRATEDPSLLSFEDGLPENQANLDNPAEPRDKP